MGLFMGSKSYRIRVRKHLTRRRLVCYRMWGQQTVLTLNGDNKQEVDVTLYVKPDVVRKHIGLRLMGPLNPRLRVTAVSEEDILHSGVLRRIYYLHSETCNNCL